MIVHFGALTLVRTIVRSIQSFDLFRYGNRLQLKIVVINNSITAETRNDIVETGSSFTDCVGNASEFGWQRRLVFGYIPVSIGLIPFSVGNVSMRAIEKFDKRIGLCIDVGHTARAGVDPADSIVKCQERLYDVHIKDISAMGDKNTPIEGGRGILETRGCLRLV